jgi:hypothetical protein
MPFPAGVNFARFQMFSKSADKVWSNTLWFTTASAFPPTWDISAAAIAFENKYVVTGLTNTMSSNANYIGSNLLIHNGGLARSSNTYTVVAGSGSSANEIPDDACCVVSRLTATPGKSGRGRLYHSGIPNDFVAENRLTPLGAASFSGYCTVLKSALTDQTMLWSPANWSKLTNAFHAALDFIAEPVLGTQRHRKPRR